MPSLWGNSWGGEKFLHSHEIPLCIVDYILPRPSVDGPLWCHPSRCVVYLLIYANGPEYDEWGERSTLNESIFHV